MVIDGFTEWTPPAKIEPGMTRFWPKHLPVDAVVDVIFNGTDHIHICLEAEHLFWGQTAYGATITHYRIVESIE